MTNIVSSFKQIQEANHRQANKFSYKALIFGATASAFEWYDYALFGYFSTVIGNQFFPSSNPFTSLLASFGVFASGFIMRPLGSVFFGYIGDRIGRKHALLLSLLLVSVPTMALGLLPNYEIMGIWSSIALVVIRLFQGLAVGGNYGGSFIYTIDHAPPEQRGFSSSLASFGVLGGLLLGSGCASVMSAILSPSDIASWGWRLPFILGGVIGFIGYFIRHQVPDLRLDIPAEVLDRQPLSIVLKEYPKNFLKAMGVVLLDAVGIYTIFVFMITFMTLFLGLPEDKVLLVNTIGMMVLVFTIPFFGWLGDKISQRLILKWVSLGFFIVSIPLFSLLTYCPSLKFFILLQMTFSILMGAVYGALPTFVATLFPSSIRYTATGVAFNLTLALFGGTAPFFMTFVIHKTGFLLIPAVFLTIVGMVSWLCLRTRDTY